MTRLRRLFARRSEWAEMQAREALCAVMAKGQGRR